MAMAGIPRQSTGDTVPVAEKATQPSRSRSSTWPVIVGTGITVGVGIGVWLGIGAMLAALAGPESGAEAPYWRDLVYGSSTLGSTFLLARRGVASIPRELRRLDLQSTVAVSFPLLLLILQFLAGFMMVPSIQP
jgi:hypothetical protein